ncbi:MAG TPA: SH3 domain-containing protein, partial [Blastocatellia bacterium]|nr:SH3 domain-containing protein [Blastocatellia bacterium]
MPGSRSNHRAGFFLVAALCLSCGGRGSSEEAARSLIIVTSGVRVRSGPAASAGEVTRLNLGAVVRQLERTSSRERVAGIEDYWYRVATPDGKEGWVFGGYTASYEASDR